MKRFTRFMAVLMLTMAALFTAGCQSDGNNDNQANARTFGDVRVTTYMPQDITQTSAVCGGDVIVTPGLSLTALGVCWGTEPKPTVADAYLSTTNWSGNLVCTLTGLVPCTTYYVRAFVLRGLDYYYGDVKSFTTEGDNGICDEEDADEDAGEDESDEHEYVDLGLPSGTLWATCNVGANTPEEFGDYFAWGETTTKAVYNYGSYKFSFDGRSESLTKYCNDPTHGYNGFTDTLTVLQSVDDAATANWGSEWRMPTMAQFIELYQNTTPVWTTQNGVTGRLFTATNGKSLFLPAAGYRLHDAAYEFGAQTHYWSSTLDIEKPYRAQYLFSKINDLGVRQWIRDYGKPVRPVRSSH